MRTDATDGTAGPARSAAQSDAPGTPGTPATIKKGITLRVQVYVEGEDAPANDFSKVGQAFLSQVLAAGMREYTGPYTLSVEKVEALEGSDASDEG
jgi:hypothetical protein